MSHHELGLKKILFVTTNLTNTDFLEGPLPIDGLNPVEFERLAFYLLDEMGFNNISWRKGGEGNSATDGGRDLEATFWRLDPIAPKEEHYWFEIKYRSSQLDKRIVQQAVFNAAGREVVDHFVIITNDTVSNPCIDWVTDFIRTHKRPCVTIWQGHDLELILRKNPRTLAQFFTSVLSEDGKLKILESKFRNMHYLPSGTELEHLWHIRDKLIRDEKWDLLLASIFAEFAHGNINMCPWGISIDSDARLTLAIIAIYNTIRYAHLCETYSKSQSPFLEGISYLLQCILQKDTVSEAYAVLFETEQYVVDAQPLTPIMRKIIVEPILNTVLDNLAVQCSAHCLKLEYRERKEERLFPYFYRFIVSPQEEASAEDDSFLVIHFNHTTCAIDLVEDEQNCPLAEGPDIDQMSKTDILNLLEFLRSVLTRRIEETREEEKKLTFTISTDPPLTES